MLCAAIDIGSNTTRVLVAEPQDGQLRKVMEQRAYTRIGKASQHDGAIDLEKIDEVAEVVATQVRLAQEIGAQAIRTVATAAIREAANRDGDIAVVDVGGGSSEVVLGSIADGVSAVRSFKIGSGSLADDLLTKDPPSPSEIRRLRDAIEDFFADVEFERPDQAVAVGGSATSLRALVGTVLEYETLERAVRVLTGGPIDDVAKRFELDPRRVRILPTGVLLLEKLSELLGQPLQIGKGGLREGVILTLLNGASNGAPKALAA
jgi:exopolyphosphatase/guanosine-5'-triphosphate,3'-diphosphate pyrophosphatase